MLIWLYVLPNKIQQFSQMLICKLYKNIFYTEFVLILVINLHGEFKYLDQTGHTFFPKNKNIYTADMFLLYKNIFMINVPSFQLPITTPNFGIL
jgi:hypothetical protein